MTINIHLLILADDLILTNVLFRSNQSNNEKQVSKPTEMAIIWRIIALVLIIFCNNSSYILQEIFLYRKLPSFPQVFTGFLSVIGNDPSFRCVMSFWCFFKSHFLHSRWLWNWFVIKVGRNNYLESTMNCNLLSYYNMNLVNQWPNWSVICLANQYWFGAVNYANYIYRCQALF